MAALTDTIRPTGRRRGAAAALALVALVLAACGSGAATTSTTSSTSSTAPGGLRATTATGMFGRRYCELILVNAHSAPLTAQVWNTYPLNTCPPAAWAAVDTAAVASAHGSSAAVRNGPRYWAVDSVTKYASTPLATADLGGLSMHLDATLRLGSLSTTPYLPHRVDRNTVFSYRAGRTVFELHGADGSTWVMQSWSQQIDPGLVLADLAGLGFRLHLPAGWTYTTRVLSTPLRVMAVTTPAVVLQDDLGNSYSRES